MESNTNTNFNGVPTPEADTALPFSAHQIVQMPIGDLKPNPKNARTHSSKQKRQIARSMRRFGFTGPILIDENKIIISGHGRHAAAKHLGIKSIPTICIAHLSEVQKRALALADNKIAMNAGWDLELLANELEELTLAVDEDGSDFDIEITGFETAEADNLFCDFEAGTPGPANEEVELPSEAQVIVSKSGYIWELDKHRLACGDCRDRDLEKELFQDELASQVTTDPPYNLTMTGHVGGRGSIKHDEFAFASGEMSFEEFRKFLQSSLEIMAMFCKPGALIYVFMDWRHVEDLLCVGRSLGLELKNICVWNKTTPGQGSFYRSAHELVVVFQKPGGKATNNIQLGRFGRNRSNVWTYPGVNTFQAKKGGDLSLHPTVKPTAMIVEAIKDASKRNEIVFDPFLGSGTTMLACEQVGRRCFGIEYEPKFVDLAVRRWQEMTGKDAVLVGLAPDGVSNAADQKLVGLCYSELAEQSGTGTTEVQS